MNRASYGILRCCYLGALVLAGAAAASATPAGCVTDTLANYIALDKTGGCTIGDFILFRFTSPTTSVTGNPPVAESSQITVTPILNSSGVGLGFSAEVNGTNLFSIPTQGDSVTYHINYTLDPPVVGGEDLSMDPPFGDVTITQRYCLNDVFDSEGNCPLGILAPQNTVTTSSPSSEVLFPTPSSFIDVQTDIMLNAPAGFDGVTSEFLTGPVVPEPANALLTGFGFCLLSGLIYATRKLGARRA